MRVSLRHALRAVLTASVSLAAATSQAQYAYGSDVSWTDQEEASGYTFKNASGVKTDPFVLLKGLGINAIRLRVWVNPTGGWNNGADDLYMAKRASAQGQRILIDFHYSDTWADPGTQTIPAQWTDHSLSALETQVYNHTYGILNYLKTNGINVTWVQVGNEINSGMLWPTGKVSGTTGFGNLAGLINSGYNATKAVFPSASVIVHLANGHDDATFRWFFDNLKSQGGKWDVIGMSHYPTASNWSTLNPEAGTTMADVASRYGSTVMVCETGMPWDGPSAAQSMLTDLINRNKALGSKGLGVFYWEPEAYPGWQGYTWGAVNASGQFTAAMNAF
jgi:arabinogalactan endo-1,4-beta-galactosidase